ncbi:MAG: hypothetical protein ACLVBJ_04775 [Pilosibacter sp.]
MMKNMETMKNRKLRLRAACGLLAVLAAAVLTACGSSGTGGQNGTEAASRPWRPAPESAAEAESVLPAPGAPSPEEIASMKAEEAGDFFTIMQKFSAGEIEAVPFEKLSENDGQYGVVSLAEDPESGLNLFGYMAPGNRYEGIYLMDKDSRVNAFPTAVYATDALICPTISWDKETSTLTVTVWSSEAESQDFSFQQKESGLSSPWTSRVQPLSSPGHADHHKIHGLPPRPRRAQASTVLPV